MDHDRLLSYPYSCQLTSSIKMEINLNNLVGSFKSSVQPTYEAEVGDGDNPSESEVGVDVGIISEVNDPLSQPGDGVEEVRVTSCCNMKLMAHRERERGRG